MIKKLCSYIFDNHRECKEKYHRLMNDNLYAGSEIYALNEKLEKLHKKIEDQTDTIHKFSQHISTLEEGNRILTKRHDDANDLLCKQIERLKESLQVEVQDNADHKEDIAAYIKDIDELGRQINSQIDTINKFQQNEKELLNQIQELKAIHHYQTSDLEKEIESLEKELAMVRKEKKIIIQPKKKVK
jgi:chromosome segregation ATPase